MKDAQHQLWKDSLYGLPIVAYAIDGIPELINNNVDGHLVTPGQSHKLTDAILNICKILQMGKRWVTLAEKRY